MNSICTSKGGTHVNYIADQVGASTHALVAPAAPACGRPALACCLALECLPLFQLPTCSACSAPHLPSPRLQVVKNLCEMINKKDKKANVKPFMAKNYLWVFVNCLIENPAFDSQVGRMGWVLRGPAGGQAG